MARYGQRPENALKRANEFIEVGKPARALDTLYEVFRNKKWAYSWSESVLEPIMFKYLDLCVELKKSHIAKEGLFQYRNMFQSVNVSSLENVIRGYLRTAEERTEAAREQSQQAVVDIDDLDMLATPESLLLSAVSGEDAQDRSDRTILTPWVKFLWESYCQCLELLRTNAHVENLYHDIARMAFSFCLKYARKTEFRKLCDKLRKHLEDIGKLPAQAANVSIHRPETQQLNLDTRLVQLDSAIQMELWQEAYKAIEDIHGLMNLSKKLPVPKTMANYYQKLAMVFWKAGNYLFHAAALFKLFQLSKEMKKNITPEELQRLACRVLLATLSIPLPSAHPEFDRFIETDKSPLEKAQRLAILLGLSQPPTRASLLRDIVRVNVVSLASPQLQDLYLWLEVEFDPLLLCKRVHGATRRLADEEGGAHLQQYVRALQDVTLVRLVRQLSQVYQTVRTERLVELAVFASAFHLERLLVDCVRHNDMQIRIDHGSGCINFGMDLAEAQREDHPEGPTLQSMPSEQVRSQLVNMACVLHRAMSSINPAKKKMEREKLRAQMVQHYHETKNREHQRILARHKIIEDRKEYLERLNTVREEEEARRLEELARQQMLAEQKRLEQEREERERKRQENEIQQIKDRHLKEKMQQISQTSHGQKILKKLDEDDIKKLDAEQIAAREMEELQKEKRELMQKLKSQEKKVDYLERAKRVEEIPLLRKALEEKQVQDRAFWEQQEAERIQLVVGERELAVQHRERLARMKADKEAFLEKLRTERRTVYLEKLKEFEKMLEEEREKRLAERRLERKEERRSRWIKEREEEELRKKEEEERQKLEEERLKREEEERKEKLRKEQQEEEYRKQREMLDRQAEKQRQREAEAEERRLEQERLLLAQTSQSSSWRQGRGAVPPPPAQLRDREPAEAPPATLPAAALPAADRSDWRKGGGGLAPAAAREEPLPPKKDAWRPAPRSEREPEAKTDSSSWRRGRDGDAGKDTERDGGGRSFGDRDRRGGFDSERDGGRGFERDREGGRVGGFGRDRDGGRRGFGDREGGRSGFGDREGGRSGFGDREGGRGGFDRDREGGRGAFDRDAGRGGFDRDRDRPSDRSGGSASMGSWRSKPAEPEGDDSRRRVDDRRPAAAPVRAPVKDVGPPRRMPPGPDDKRREAAPPDDNKPEEKATPPQKEEEQTTEQAAPVAEEGEDGNWQKVSRR
ncbi:eukaryotic translation initiation factor 3 subunit A [Bacillus rossius redtenbacheri]|uniref:eukaryotic translation initiation factor 3 subunit A n=1 Tax=Bacillus rossius redtenbacheri TaxID=93214 RepID=UPI002FDDAF12